MLSRQYGSLPPLPIHLQDRSTDPQGSATDPGTDGNMYQVLAGFSRAQVILTQVLAVLPALKSAGKRGCGKRHENKTQTAERNERFNKIISDAISEKNLENERF